MGTEQQPLPADAGPHCSIVGFGGRAGGSCSERRALAWTDLGRQHAASGPLTSRSRPLEMTPMVPVLRWMVNMLGGSFGSWL